MAVPYSGSTVSSIGPGGAPEAKGCGENGYEDKKSQHCVFLYSNYELKAYWGGVGLCTPRYACTGYRYNTLKQQLNN